jgi:pyruvate formate lyase activating enzyme
MLIEGENDSEDEIKAECEWIIKNIGDCVPLHFSAFFPQYKFQNRKQTSFETLVKAYNIAKTTGIKYVYTGNLSNVQTSTTYCKNCGKPIIIRNGYQMLEYNLEQGRCKFCSTQCDGCF